VPLDPLWPFFRLPGQGCCPGDEPRVGRVVSVCGLQVGRVESSRVQSWVESHRVVEKEKLHRRNFARETSPCLAARCVLCRCVRVCVRALVGVLLETNVVGVVGCSELRSVRIECEPRGWNRRLGQDFARAGCLSDILTQDVVIREVRTACSTPSASTLRSGRQQRPIVLGTWHYSVSTCLTDVAIPRPPASFSSQGLGRRRVPSKVKAGKSRPPQTRSPGVEARQDRPFSIFFHPVTWCWYRREPWR
jgi:hypothetical protein